LLLQRTGERIDQQTRQRQHEQNEEQRKFEPPNGSPALHCQQHTANYRDQGAHLEDNDILGASQHIKREPEDQASSARSETR
jgi:hypothetical protein